MSRTYPALGIPTTQRQVLDLEPRPTPADAAAGAMAYHWSVVGDGATPLDANGSPAYLPVWKFFSGIRPATSDVFIRSAGVREPLEKGERPFA